jgi:hypothetical protein
MNPMNGIVVGPRVKLHNFVAIELLGIARKWRGIGRCGLLAVISLAGRPARREFQSYLIDTAGKFGAPLHVGLELDILSIFVKIAADDYHRTNLQRRHEGKANAAFRDV